MAYAGCVLTLGAGKIAEAMVAGWLESGGVRPDQVRMTNRRDDRRLEELRRRYGVVVGRDPALLRGVTELVVAVKPPDVPAALARWARDLPAGATVISVAAGVRLERLRELLGGMPGVLRAMPNTSCRVRQSPTAFCAAPGCEAEALERARGLLELLGPTLPLPEEAFDAVTAVAGSGPAYVYLLAEAMVEAAVELGLPHDAARELVAVTVAGAGRMLVATGLGAAELRRQVTSPRGTTAAALEVLIERADVPGAVREAVRRAAARARELSAAAGGDAAGAGAGGPFLADAVRSGSG